MSNIFLISVEKAGTHIMWSILGNRGITIIHSSHVWPIEKHPVAEALEEIKNSSGLMHAHLPYTDEYKDALEQIVEHRGYKVLFLYRDPRDVIVSRTHWMNRGHFDGDGWKHLPDDRFREHVEKCWLNGKGHAFFKASAGWLDVPWIFKIRYEDLMMDTDKAVARVGEIIGPNFGDHATLMRRTVKESGPVFRKGLVGEWRTWFPAGEFRDQLYAEIGECVVTFGYEL